VTIVFAASYECPLLQLFLAFAVIAVVNLFCCTWACHLANHLSPSIQDPFGIVDIGGGPNIQVLVGTGIW
jgi:hypothetical protein